MVDADGYLVTKASLLPAAKDEVFCKLPGHDSLKATVVNQNDDYDLALLKVDDSHLAPAPWRGEPASTGTFVAAIDAGGDVLGLGVVSTEPRRVGGNRNPATQRAWLGISLGGGTNGTMVTDVRERTAAQRAGLEVGDVLKGIDGMEMTSSDQIIATIGKHNPGDEIKLLVQRAGDVLELNAKLGEPPQETEPQDQWGGGPFSLRRESFPRVLTHDTIIRPEQCGGPLIDTDGQVVGVNIARTARYNLCHSR